MWICAVEEPLHKHNELYILDEPTGDLLLHKTPDDRLNRYSFVWLGNFETRDARLESLLRNLKNILPGAPQWWLTWRARIAGDDQFQNKCRDRKAEGWTVHADDTLALAHREFDPQALNGFAPAGYTRIKDDGGVILSVGAPADPARLLKRPLRNTFDSFCEHREFHPGKQLLLWMTDRNMMLGYLNRDRAGHLGIVLIGKNRLDIAPVLQAENVETVHTGPKAPKAWRVAHELKTD